MSNLNSLAVEYALLRGLNTKDYKQLKRLHELEKMMKDNS